MTVLAWGVSMSSGFGAANIVPVRLGIQKEFDKQWYVEREWPVSAYCEASFYSMHGKKGRKADSNKHLVAVAVSPVVRLQRAEKMQMGWPYVELGIGVSWVSKKEIGGRDLGIHFQFEDRLGVGVRFGEKQAYDIGYKAIHFSNAYLGPSNHGINLHVLALNYWF